MIFATDLPPGSEGLHPFAKLILPALVTLIPAGVTAVTKALQERSRVRRGADLTERICKLTKDISELPELPDSRVELPVTPRTALIAELNGAICEITALRSRPAHRIGDASTSAAAKLRSALLLYRPKGFLAFGLHVTFYLYSLVMACFLVSMATDRTNPLINFKAPASEITIDLFLFVVVSGIFSIPSVVLRNFAVRMHRKQNPDAPAAATPALAAVAVPIGAATQGD